MAASALDSALARLGALRGPTQRIHALFELFVLASTLAYLALQTLNVYRLNFYNYNVVLLGLLAIVLLRRPIARQLQGASGDKPLALMSNRQVCVYLMLASLATVQCLYLFYRLMLQQTIPKLCLLFYPVILHAYLFLERASPSNRVEAIAEAQLLNRVKSVLFGSFEAAYYGGLIPVMLLQHEYVYYDPLRSALIVVFLAVNTWVLMSCQLFCANFVELYLQAQTMGAWGRCLPPKSSSSVPQWNQESSPYKRGDVVVYKGVFYVANADHTTVEPGRVVPWVLFNIFAYPDRAHLYLIFVEGVVLCCLFVLVLVTSQWLVYGSMLVVHYASLYAVVAFRRPPADAAGAPSDNGDGTRDEAGQDQEQHEQHEQSTVPRVAGKETKPKPDPAPPQRGKSGRRRK